MTPFQLLDADADDGRAHALWSEYVFATRSRRAITWSKGLRADLLPDDDDLTDAEIVEDVEAVAPLLFSVPAEIWRVVRRDPAQVCAVLDAVEWGDIDSARELAHGRYRPWDGGGYVDLATGAVLWPCIRLVA